MKCDIYPKKKPCRMSITFECIYLLYHQLACGNRSVRAKLNMLFSSFLDINLAIAALLSWILKNVDMPENYVYQLLTN